MDFLFIQFSMNLLFIHLPVPGFFSCLNVSLDEILQFAVFDFCRCFNDPLNILMILSFLVIEPFSN